MPSSIRARSATGSRVGVPPPKKTVDAGAGRRAGRGQHAPGLRDLAERLPGVVALLHPADLVGRVGVEVAVAAAHPAERHVDVDAERALVPAVRDRLGQQAVGGCGIGDREGGGHYVTVG